MKYTTLLASFVFAFIALSVGYSTVSAQTFAAPKTCVQLSTNIRYGTSDTHTDGDVSRLQAFLVTQGLFSQSNMGTLHFGPATLRAVLAYQTAHQIPATGYVGPLTRANISSVSCGTTTPPSGTVSLYSVTPSTANVGSTVSITGFGFTSNNTILMDGNVAARNVPITSSIAIACTTNSTCHGGINQTITFAVPSSLSPYCAAGMACPMYVRLLTPGTYQVTVMNDNGTSASLPLTVTGASTGSTLSITGLDAPTTLSFNQSGTWTVRVASTVNAGTLHYSVVWGDENSVGTAAIRSNGSDTVSTTSTFTHSYAKVGTYTPVFTVIDDAGHTVTTSSTISVTPYY